MSVAASSSTADLNEGEFRLRSLIWPVYVPSFLLAVGQGAVLPIIPLFG